MGLDQVTASTRPPTFLSRYLGYDELSQLIARWAKDHPDVVRLRSLGKSEGGRDIWLIEIGREPDRPRPAICIDAGMHSTELLGTNAALAVAEILIRLHQGR